MGNDINILIVEDEIITVNFIKTGLFKYGFNNISHCLSAEHALLRVEELNPGLVLLDISLEERHSGIELAKIFTNSYSIPVIFITGGIDDQTIARIEESEPYGLLFKPFRIQTLKVLINIAIKRMEAEKYRIESEKKLEVSKIQLFEQVRELDSFFKISQLVNECSEIKNLIKGALPLIPIAFNMGDYISTRIIYRNKIYESANFKESKWVLSESLAKNYKKGDMIELHLSVEDSVESFPFSMEDINTFSAISQQLSLALQRFTFESDLNYQLKLTEILNSILQELIKNNDKKIGYLLKSMLKKLGIYFHSEFCEILMWKKKGNHPFYNKITWMPKEDIEPLDLSELTIQDLKMQTKAIYYTQEDTSKINSRFVSKQLFIENQKRNLLIIPIMIKKIQAGILLFAFSNENSFVSEHTSEFSILGDIVSLTISKANRERKILIYRQAIEQNPSTIVITDIKGTISYVNPMFTRTSGYTFKEAIGKNPRILKSGDQDPLFYKELWNSLTSGDLWKGTFHNKRKDGSLFWELAVISPIKDNSGKVTGYIALKEDISDKIEAEETLKQLNTDLLNTQASLIQEEKLASIGRLAAGVAHEINNPIGFVFSNFRTIEKYKENIQKLISSLKNNGTLDQEFLENIFEENKN